MGAASTAAEKTIGRSTRHQDPATGPMGVATTASTPGPADVVGFISDESGPTVPNPIGLKFPGPTETDTTPQSGFASANYYASLDHDPPVAQWVPASSTEQQIRSTVPIDAVIDVPIDAVIDSEIRQYGTKI